MCMNTRRNEYRAQIAGYALLEALVAVIVASVGFIGAARMQTFGMALGNSAQSRQKATLLGYQMTDRIRANRLGFDGGGYQDPANNGSVSCLATTAGCAPAALAAADVAQWAAEVEATLPQGKAKVCLDSTPNDTNATPADPKCDLLGNVIAVKIWWTDNVATSQFVTVVRP